MRGFNHIPHGDLLHDTAIFLAERTCFLNDGIFLDKAPIKRKAIAPGIPDVYFRNYWKRTDERGRRIDGHTDYCVEVETNASAESIIKKALQFEGALSNTKCIIIDLQRYEKKGASIRNLDVLNDIIAKEMPF